LTEEFPKSDDDDEEEARMDEDCIDSLRSSRFTDSRVKERLTLAIEHLATSNDKIKERVLDAYRNHFSPLLPEEFPDQETRRVFEEIRAIVREVEQRIERKPGEYESLLRNRLRTPLEVARCTLDYRVARKLAKLITRLYFEIEAGIIDEYQRELDAYKD
jgi:hypothetical protein